VLQVPQGREQYDDTFTLSLGYTGIPYLRPTVSYTRGVNVVVYEDETRSSGDHILTGRLFWAAPQANHRNDLSLALRVNESDEITASVLNTFSYTISQYASARLSLDGRYKITGAATGNNLSLTLGGIVDYRLSDSWRASLAVSYIAGETHTTKFYHSVLFSLFIAAQF
jgi:hypothetical protein